MSSSFVKRNYPTKRGICPKRAEEESDQCEEEGLPLVTALRSLGEDNPCWYLDATGRERD